MESALERNGLGPVAGVDEAGRGACAGPLTVAACILGSRSHTALADLDDSKKLTERRREELFPRIKKLALAWSVVFVDAADPLYKTLDDGQKRRLMRLTRMGGGGFGHRHWQHGGPGGFGPGGHGGFGPGGFERDGGPDGTQRGPRSPERL